MNFSCHLLLEIEKHIYVICKTENKDDNFSKFNFILECTIMA